MTDSILAPEIVFPAHADSPFETCLLTCDRHSLDILRISANAPDILKIPGLLPERNLREIFDATFIHQSLNALSEGITLGRPALLFNCHPHEKSPRVDATISLFHDEIIIECETAGGEDRNNTAHSRLHMMTGRLRNITDLPTLFNITTRLLKGITRFDRILVCRFLGDTSAKIVGERHNPGMNSFLNHRIITDISFYHTENFKRNTSFVTVDINSENIPHIRAKNAPCEPLMQTQFREPTEYYRTFLEYMGVRASLDVSLIVDSRIWGSILCHSINPCRLSLSERNIIKIFGEFISLRIMVILRTTRLAAIRSTHALINSFIRGTKTINKLPAQLSQQLHQFIPFIACDAVALRIDGKWSYSGTILSDKYLYEIIDEFQKQVTNNIWHTCNLYNQDEKHPSDCGNITGALVIPISSLPEDYLVFLRKEEIEIIDRPLAGQKEKQTEQLYGHSSRWTDEELETAALLRSTLIELLGMHHQNQLAIKTRKKNHQQLINQELTHRIKNILTVVQTLLTAPPPTDRPIEEQHSILRGRLNALAYAHDQLITSGNGGYLKHLLEAELRPYISAHDTIIMNGPNLFLNGQALSIITLVIHELTTNAVKYGALSVSSGQIKIDWHLDQKQNQFILFWQETGGPEPHPKRHKGFGSTLISGAIPYELGGSVHQDFRSAGLFIHFVIPSHYVEPATEISSPTFNFGNDMSAHIQGMQIYLQETNILIVEDQFLIVMEIEDALKKARTASVHSVASEAEALAAVQKQRPDLVLLDLNLGSGTSFSFAKFLKNEDIPFIFLSGHVDNTILPADLRNIRLLIKPCPMPTMLASMSDLLTERTAAQ
jgi:light-regulated signal transduction histidine kinase (bacteriophytochrome)/CheY-like chemotaxis protein